MADDVAITAGAGTSIATDDCTSGHAQLVKLAYSADGNRTHVQADADGMLVNLGANNDITVTSGSITANAGTNLNTSLLALESGGNLASAVTALQLIDDTIKTEDVAAGAGDKGVAVIAVRRDADTSLVDADNDYANLQVNNLGALKVEIFDGGDSHTVDGTITANAGTNLNTSLLALESGGNLASAVAALQLIDDTVFTLGTGTYAEATTKGVAVGAVRRDADTSAVGTDNEIAPLLVNAIGALKVEIFDGGDSHTVDGTVTANLATGTNTVGNVGLAPRTSGGLTTYHLVSAATTNATNIKASAGQVYGWYIYNANAAMRKVAFHNSASAPTAGASIFLTLCIPPTSAANVEFTEGIPFSSGIGITTVTGMADSDATAVAANDLNINIFYA